MPLAFIPVSGRKIFFVENFSRRALGAAAVNLLSRRKMREHLTAGASPRPTYKREHLAAAPRHRPTRTITPCGYIVGPGVPTVLFAFPFGEGGPPKVVDEVPFSDQIPK